MFALQHAAQRDVARATETGTPPAARAPVGVPPHLPGPSEVSTFTRLLRIAPDATPQVAAAYAAVVEGRATTAELAAVFAWPSVGPSFLSHLFTDPVSSQSAPAAWVPGRRTLQVRSAPFWGESASDLAVQVPLNTPHRFLCANGALSSRAEAQAELSKGTLLAGERSDLAAMEARAMAYVHVDRLRDTKDYLESLAHAGDGPVLVSWTTSGAPPDCVFTFASREDETVTGSFLVLPPILREQVLHQNYTNTHTINRIYARSCDAAIARAHLALVVTQIQDMIAEVLRSRPTAEDVDTADFLASGAMRKEAVKTPDEPGRGGARPSTGKSPRCLVRLTTGSKCSKPCDSSTGVWCTCPGGDACRNTYRRHRGFVCNAAFHLRCLGEYKPANSTAGSWTRTYLCPMCDGSISDELLRVMEEKRAAR